MPPFYAASTRLQQEAERPGPPGRSAVMRDLSWRIAPAVNIWPLAFRAVSPPASLRWDIRAGFRVLFEVRFAVLSARPGPTERKPKTLFVFSALSKENQVSGEYMAARGLPRRK